MRRKIRGEVLFMLSRAEGAELLGGIDSDHAHQATSCSLHPFGREFSKSRHPLSCGVLATLVRWNLCSVVGRFSAVSDEASLKVAELLAYQQWSKPKLYRK
jgi:hypothetical protein